MTTEIKQARDTHGTAHEEGSDAAMNMDQSTSTSQSEDIALALEQLIRLHYSQSFRHGLKPAQWHALRYFALADEADRTVTAFARHRASTMGTASTTISTLVQKGYLARDYGDGVPRNRGLHLTERGEQLLQDDPIKTLVDAIEDLSPDERQQMARIVDKLVTQMSRARTILRTGGE